MFGNGVDQLIAGDCVLQKFAEFIAEKNIQYGVNIFF